MEKYSTSLQHFKKFLRDEKEILLHNFDEFIEEVGSMKGSFLKKLNFRKQGIYLKNQMNILEQWIEQH